MRDGLLIAVRMARFASPLVLLVACGGSGSASVNDASRADASTTDAGSSDAAVDATSTDGAEDDASDDSGFGFDATGLPSIDAGGPPGCTGSSDCVTGEICCFDVAAVRAAPTCVTGSSCPSDEAQLCGKTGKGVCHGGGTCMDYECTVREPSLKLTFYACSAPDLPSVACSVVFPDDDAGNDSGEH